MNTFFKELDAIVDAGWAQIKQGKYWQHSLANPTSPSLYQQIMLQVYHYTRYNSVNQAACAFSADPEQTTLSTNTRSKSWAMNAWCCVTWSRSACCRKRCLRRWHLLRR